METYFVEWVGQQAQPLNAVLTFEARVRDAQNREQRIGQPDSVTFYRFQTVVIAIGGFLQNNPTLHEEQAIADTAGIYRLATWLYRDLGYDVHVYAPFHQHTGLDEEGWFQESVGGTGLAYMEAISAIRHRSVDRVVAMGFSYGAGAVRNLLWRLKEKWQGRLEAYGEDPLGFEYTVPFTAYIDAIVHGSTRAESESRLPLSTDYHVNLYQRIDTTRINIPPYNINGIRGTSIPRSAVDHDVNDPMHGYGENIRHTDIDDNWRVLMRIRDEFIRRTVPH